jgi:hypothetical protein
LKPGPKAAAVRSYACRWLLPAGAEPLSVSASRSPAAGIAMIPSPATTAIAVISGRLVTPRTQRSPIDGRSVVSRRAAREPALGRSRSPAKPSRAGISVTAMATAKTTAAAADRPIVVRKGMRTTDRPDSAMTTVRPANTTAVPAVAVARAADSATVIPADSWDRCRATMNSA